MLSGFIKREIRNLLFLFLMIKRFFEVIKMCQHYKYDELEEMCEDPNFCVVCFMNRPDVKVVEHICEECLKG